jgi:hypothetical protein
MIISTLIAYCNFWITLSPRHVAFLVTRRFALNHLDNEIRIRRLDAGGLGTELHESIGESLHNSQIPEDSPHVAPIRMGHAVVGLNTMAEHNAGNTIDQHRVIVAALRRGKQGRKVGNGIRGRSGVEDLGGGIQRGCE